MLPENFFPTLVRRAEYARKHDGSYYANYGHYRSAVAEDCRHRCGYCDAHQDEIGGERLMQLDHFRPHSIVAFKHLYNDPNNLVYACVVCNREKWDWWPPKSHSSTYENGVGFLDPFVETRSQFFECKSSGEIIALADPALYLIRLLLLNRAFLRKVREARYLRAQIVESGPRIHKWIEDVENDRITVDPKEVAQIVRVLMDIVERALGVV